MRKDFKQSLQKGMEVEHRWSRGLIRFVETSAQIEYSTGRLHLLQSFIRVSDLVVRNIAIAGCVFCNQFCLRFRSVLMGIIAIALGQNRYSGLLIWYDRLIQEWAPTVRYVAGSGIRAFWGRVLG